MRADRRRQKMDSRRKEAAWSQFFHMIREQFPHCKIINLTVL